MIDLAGKTADEAIAALRAAGFSGEVEVNKSALDCDAPKVPGKVRCQRPEAGALAYRNQMISVAVHEEWKHEGLLVRAQLAKAKGMTVEQAKQYLKSIGFVGTFDVREWQGYPPPEDCVKTGVRPDRVCHVAPEDGVSVDDQIGLIMPKSKPD